MQSCPRRLAAWSRVELVQTLAGGARNQVYLARRDRQQLVVRQSTRPAASLDWELDLLELDPRQARPDASASRCQAPQSQGCPSKPVTSGWSSANSSRRRSIGKAPITPAMASSPASVYSPTSSDPTRSGPRLWRRHHRKIHTTQYRARGACPLVFSRDMALSQAPFSKLRGPFSYSVPVLFLIDPGPILHAEIQRYDDPDIETGLQQEGVHPATATYRLIDVSLDELQDTRWFPGPYD